MTTATSDWVGVTPAGRLLGGGQGYRVYRAALLGKVRTRIQAREAPIMFHVGDLMRLREEEFQRRDSQLQ